nr:MAG TPA: hypothetical protein [Caudoviricetes sp.]DAW85547.1 MAG TPA: hypothetical protein [Caudoviricetes sp.]
MEVKYYFKICEIKCLTFCFLLGILVKQSTRNLAL